MVTYQALKFYKKTMESYLFVIRTIVQRGNLVFQVVMINIGVNFKEIAIFIPKMMKIPKFGVVKRKSTIL